MVRDLILTFDGGGLCNRIFPFANALAAGWERNTRIVNPVFSHHSANFRGSQTAGKTLQFDGREYISPSYRMPLWRWRQRLMKRLTPKASFRASETEPLNIEQVLEQHPHLRQIWVEALYCLSPTHFERHAAAVREYFRPVQPIEDEVDRHLSAARSGADVLIGVHIRQGDYKFHDHGSLYYETNEYLCVMQQVQALFPAQNVRFLICSNVRQDPQELRGVDWCPGPRGQVTDLYALAGCDLIMGAPSSYTQWASFYGQVPRYVYNRKCEELAGQETKTASLQDFQIHRTGFGRYINKL